MKGFRLATILLLAFSPGCSRQQDGPEKSSIAVTTTYLQSAVQDLTDGTIPVVCLSEPGMCPGHFDLSPEQIQQLLTSRLLLRFDFQSGLDSHLRRISTTVVPMEAPAGLCIPQTYLQVCRQTAEVLEKAFPEKKALFRRRLALLEEKAAQASAAVREQIEAAGLKNCPVLASRHQAEFARWLGLNVVGTFRAADQMSPAEIADCLNMGRQHSVKFLIANRQEGTELAERMASSLGARSAVFSNFPSVENGRKGAFFELLQNNLQTLLP